jgi:NADPH-dependent 2,4-dienoyl-CoA reductase/sulfur reductase-like enzyme
VTRAEGDDVVRAVTLTDGRRSWTERCDLLCTGYGLVPNTELAALVGCDLAGGAVVVDDCQETSVPGSLCAGEPTGVAGVAAALAEGEIAGLAAVGGERAAMIRQFPRLRAARARERTFAAGLQRTFAPRAELRSLAEPGTIICRCEDLPLEALDPGWCARRARLYARAGMGPCQARVCGPALEYLFGWDATATRTPVLPAAISTLIHSSESAAGAEGAD